MTATNTTSPKRSRRLRKKLRVDEFQELGFEIQVTVESEDVGLDEYLDAFLAFIEAQGWVCGGSGDDKHFSGFITSQERGSLTPEAQHLLKQWLEAQAWCQSVVFGELEDAWNEG